MNDVVRRETAYGVATRLTGHHDELPLTGEPFGSDAATATAISDYIEEYLDETGVTVSIRRDRFDDLVANPFDEWTLEFLAHRFPAADLEEIHRFLDAARA